MTKEWPITRYCHIVFPNLTTIESTQCVNVSISADEPIDMHVLVTKCKMNTSWLLHSLLLTPHICYLPDVKCEKNKTNDLFCYRQNCGFLFSCKMCLHWESWGVIGLWRVFLYFPIRLGAPMVSADASTIKLFYSVRPCAAAVCFKINAK